MRVEHHPLDGAFEALPEHGLDGADEALRILVNEAAKRLFREPRVLGIGLLSVS
jgi:hypothetical protein